jgi:hypothetical protein
MNFKLLITNSLKWNSNKHLKIKFIYNRIPRKGFSIKEKKPQENLIKLAEMKVDIFYLVKYLRLISLYSFIPYNVVAFSYSRIFEDMIVNFFFSNFFLFVPYLITQNMVVKLYYDKFSNSLLVEKLNFFCKISERKQDLVEISKINKTPFRPFASFKNTKTQEIFSLEKICEFYKSEIYNSIIIDRKNAFVENSGKSNKRMIDEKMGKNAQTLLFAKVLVAINVFVVLLFALRTLSKSAKQNSDIGVKIN